MITGIYLIYNISMLKDCIYSNFISVLVGALPALHACIAGGMPSKNHCLQTELELSLNSVLKRFPHTPMGALAHYVSAILEHCQRNPNEDTPENGDEKS
jgi:hypothetical protein